MSGGSFDYAYFTNLQFSEDLMYKLKMQGQTGEENDYPEPVWPENVTLKLAKIAYLAEYVGYLMREVEWLYSGDSSDDSFMSNIENIKYNVNGFKKEETWGETLPYEESEKGVIDATYIKLLTEYINKVASLFDDHDSLQTEFEKLRARFDSAPPAIMDTRDLLGICAPREEDFPALYALQGKRVRLVLETEN